MNNLEKFQYKDKISWFGKIFEIIKVGSANLKDGKTCSILYTVLTKYPYTIKIFYEKEMPHRRFLCELKNQNLYEQIVEGFQQEIIKSANIEHQYKIFNPKQRKEYEKKELQKRKEFLKDIVKKNNIEPKNNAEAKNKIQELMFQLDYLRKSKEDPINYPPLKFNTAQEARDYMDYLIANKDKIPPLTKAEELEAVDIFKDVSYSNYEKRK